MRVGILCLLALFLACGCTIRKSDIPVFRKDQKVKLPENIFKTSPNKYNPKSKIMVFEFESPDYAPQIGNNAAEILSQNLLKNQIFDVVYYEPAKLSFTLEQKLKFGRQKDCAFIIMGKVNYYFEGSMVQESRVDEEFKVYDAETSELAWHAEAITISSPVTENDYTLVTIKGEKPYSGAALLSINALKFCKLLISK
jgi:hypothetical protein